MQGRIGERGCQWQRLGGEPRDWGRDAGRLQHRGGEGGWWARRARNSGLGGEPRDWASDTGRVGNCSAGVRSGAGGLQRFGPVGWEVSHRRRPARGEGGQEGQGKGRRLQLLTAGAGGRHEGTCAIADLPCDRPCWHTRSAHVIVVLPLPPPSVSTTELCPDMTMYTTMERESCAHCTGCSSMLPHCATMSHCCSCRRTVRQFVSLLLIKVGTLRDAQMPSFLLIVASSRMVHQSRSNQGHMN